MPERPPRGSELAFIAEARVARLATVSATGRPAVVPICFALIDHSGEPLVVSVLDEKPKHRPDAELARVRNILANPEVALVTDHYDENWATLAFVQLHGSARLIEPGDPLHAPAITALRTRYPQYDAMQIECRPVIAIASLTATSWRGDGTRFT